MAVRRTENNRVASYWYGNYSSREDGTIDGKAAFINNSQYLIMLDSGLWSIRDANKVKTK